MQGSRETPWEGLWQLILIVHSSVAVLSWVTWGGANMHGGGTRSGGIKSEAEYCGWVASPQGTWSGKNNWKQQKLVSSKVICCGGEGWVGGKKILYQEFRKVFELWGWHMTSLTLMLPQTMTMRVPQTCLLGWTKDGGHGICLLVVISVGLSVMFPSSSLGCGSLIPPTNYRHS